MKPRLCFDPGGGANASARAIAARGGVKIHIGWRDNAWVGALREGFRMSIVKGAVLFLCIGFFTSCASRENNPVGMKLYHFKDETRKSWVHANESRPLDTMVWYPAKEGTAEKNHSIAIFSTGRYAVDAPIREIKAYPLIILSHGTGGSAASMAWFARTLAQNGYVVAAVNHHGNSGAEPEYTLSGFVLWWERAKDISKVIDLMLDDEYLRRIVDEERIGVAGFSLGGYSALAVAGAMLHVEDWRKLRSSPGYESISRLPPEAKFTLDDVDRMIEDDAVAIESIKHADDDYRDARVKAAFLMAPVLVPLMEKESLRNISVPIGIVAGDRDDQSVLEENGIPLSESVEDSNLVIIPGVGHYIFLCEGNLRGKLFARKYTLDSNAIDRGKVHRDVARLAVDFFDSSLWPRGRRTRPGNDAN
jgi:predicted dienelactone hydrolase